MSAADSGTGIEILLGPSPAPGFPVPVSVHRHWLQLLLHHLSWATEKPGLVSEGRGRREKRASEGRREKGEGRKGIGLVSEEKGEEG